jgi:hypothetical protein
MTDIITILQKIIRDKNNIIELEGYSNYVDTNSSISKSHISILSVTPQEKHNSYSPYSLNFIYTIDKNTVNEVYKVSYDVLALIEVDDKLRITNTNLYYNFDKIKKDITYTNIKLNIQFNDSKFITVDEFKIEVTDIYKAIGSDEENISLYSSYGDYYESCMEENLNNILYEYRDNIDDLIDREFHVLLGHDGEDIILATVKTKEVGTKSLESSHLVLNKYVIFEIYINTFLYNKSYKHPFYEIKIELSADNFSEDHIVEAYSKDTVTGEKKSIYPYNFTMDMATIDESLEENLGNYSLSNLFSNDNDDSTSSLSNFTNTLFKIIDQYSTLQENSIYKWSSDIHVENNGLCFYIKNESGINHLVLGKSFEDKDIISNDIDVRKVYNTITDHLYKITINSKIDSYNIELILYINSTNCNDIVYASSNIIYDGIQYNNRCNPKVIGFLWSCIYDNSNIEPNTLETFIHFYIKSIIENGTIELEDNKLSERFLTFSEDRSKDSNIHVSNDSSIKSTIEYGDEIVEFIKEYKNIINIINDFNNKYSQLIDYIEKNSQY